MISDILSFKGWGNAALGVKNFSGKFFQPAPPPPPSGPFFDNFNRANADLEDSPTSSSGGLWTHDGLITGALQILSNTLNCNTNSSTGSAYKCTNQGTADHYVQYTVMNADLATGPFACCRLADQGNFVGIRTGSGTGNGQIEVYRRVGGSLAHLYSSPAGTVVNGDVVRLQVIGDEFTVRVNGTLLEGPSLINEPSLNSTDSGILARVIPGMLFEDFESGPAE